MGSASAPANRQASDGPIARTITFFGCVPVIMNPPIRTLSPVSTRKRVEMFAKVVAGGGACITLCDLKTPSPKVLV